MPIYEYACSGCSGRFELLVPMSEASTMPPCPECKSPDTRKLLSMFATTGGASNEVATAIARPKGGGHSHGGCGPCGCGH